MIVSMVPACVIPSHNHSKLTLCAADLAGFRNQQLFVSGPGNVSTRGQVIDINRSQKIEIPRLRKRQHSAPGYLSQLSPREAERPMSNISIFRTTPIFKKTIFSVFNNNKFL